jgi:tricorn protease
MGGVISTPEENVLDLGCLRVPDRGWFLPDGRDMELNGAVPDVVLWLEPADEVAKADPQLDKAVELLLQEIEDRKNNPPPRLVTASEARAAASKPDQPEKKTK